MLSPNTSRFFLSLTSLAFFANCSSEPGPGTGTGGQLASTGGVGTGSVPGTGGQVVTTGGSSTGGVQNTGGATGGGANTGGAATGGTGGAATGGTGGIGGATGGVGGATTGGAGGVATGGGSNPDVDQLGKMNAAPGAMTEMPQDYLRLGDVRILNNNWGSEDLGCVAPNSTMSVFVNNDNSFGWNFNRGDCASATDTSHPDFPQLEFGIHPFGIGSDLATSPEFSSTTVLPIQIKDVTSASIILDNLTIALQNRSSWNLAMEFWLSERHPVTDPNPGVYAELMAWWGWDQGRWPCDLNGDGMVDYGPNVPAGDLSYTLCHQSDNWADGWRYFQFRAGDGSDGNIRENFNGKVDVKKFLEYLVKQRGYSQDLWITRMEVGSEIDDNTSGTVSMKGVTFEVNGQMRSQVIAAP